jgi:hypothetical protein
MQDLEALGDMLGRHHAGTDMFRGAGHAGIHGVDIEIMAGEHVARRDRALVEMDMLALVDDAGAVIEIDEDGIAIAARLDIVVLGIASIEHEIARADGERVLDERLGQAQAPMLIHEGALGGQDLDAGGDRLAEADLLEEVERRLMDALHVALAERLVLAAFHAGTDGRLFTRDGPCPERLARFASATPP